MKLPGYEHRKEQEQTYIKRMQKADSKLYRDVYNYVYEELDNRKQEATNLNVVLIYHDRVDFQGFDVGSDLPQGCQLITDSNYYFIKYRNELYWIKDPKTTIKLPNIKFNKLSINEATYYRQVFELGIHGVDCLENKTRKGVIQWLRDLI